ncbi:FAD-dependent oxidoreductase [Actinosynnema sp. NPDC020468]|uniref:NAD(P)/FAD-dependent oxidoreductase n=1 Tax=Actinosynnema sp. NPDC020468 TaxID=3154488 RepID=UPI0033CD8B88
MAQRIVVVGAGYAGLSAAKQAARWTDAEVTLVNERDHFVERVRLHQLASGQDLKGHPLAELLRGTGVRLVVDRVVGVDPEERKVRLEGGALAYDRLVYALGSRADLDRVPGAREHAFTVASWDQAVALRARLASASRVVVTGGGLTGIEAATEIAESHPGVRVVLVTGGEVGPGLSVKGRAYLRRVFAGLSIEVREHVRVTGVRADGVELGDEVVPADAVVWTAGFTVPDLAREAGFAVDGHGRLVVDEHLRSVSHPEVVGLGDAAALRRRDGQELRMACATALPTAQRAMKALAATVAGTTEPRAHRFGYVSQCVSLGRRDALIQFVRPDDSPRELILTGRAAARVKEAIVKATVFFQRHPTIPGGA